MQISEQERQRRSEAIRKARNSVRLEGVVLDAEIEALNQRFIDGDIDKAEHTRLILEHVGLSGATNTASVVEAVV